MAEDDNGENTVPLHLQDISADRLKTLDNGEYSVVPSEELEMILHVGCMRVDNGDAFNNEDLQRATHGSAAVDLRSTERVELMPGETHLISSGIAIDLTGLPLAGLVIPRSGRGHKEGLVLGNGVGLIDSDYQGPILISAFNRNPNVLWRDVPLSHLGDGGDNPSITERRPVSNETPIVIEKGEKIAQLMIIRYEKFEFNWVDSFVRPTARGEGGFGSTGN